MRVKSSARATKKKCICKTEPIPDLASYKFNSNALSRKGKHSHHIGSRRFQIPKLLMTQRKRGSRLNIGFFLEKTLSSGRILNWGSKILASLPENLSAPAILLVILNGKELPSRFFLLKIPQILVDHLALAGLKTRSIPGQCYSILLTTRNQSVSDF